MAAPYGQPPLHRPPLRRLQRRRPRRQVRPPPPPPPPPDGPLRLHLRLQPARPEAAAAAAAVFVETEKPRLALEAGPRGIAEARALPRLRGPAVRRAREDRRLVHAVEPPGGVAGVPVVERGAPAAEGGDAAAPLGEAVQARPGRGGGELGEGPRLVPEGGGAWVHARHGRRWPNVLGDGEEGGRHRVV